MRSDSSYIIITSKITVMKRIELSIILPTYNEAGNIVTLIKKIKPIIKKYSHEILVIDDDSPDGTAKITSNQFSWDPSVKIYIRRKDKGLAKAVKFGIEKAQGKYILAMDTDFNHNPEAIPFFIADRNSYDLIIGSRYITGGGMEDRTRYVLSYLYNIFIQIILSLPTHDNLSGFFLIKKSFLKDISLNIIFVGYGDYFIRLLHQAHKKQLRIKEIPVFYKNRTAGVSKSQFIPMFVDYTKTILDILLHP